MFLQHRGAHADFQGLEGMTEVFHRMFPRISDPKLSLRLIILGRAPSAAGTLQRKFQKDPGNALRAFPGIALGSTAGIPQAL